MCTEKDIYIIAEPTSENPFLVLKKPGGLPSAPLYEGDDSAFTRAAEIYPFLKDIHGKKDVEHGLVHRIDTDTDGLILIAATQESYESLCAAQKNGNFIKGYSASCVFAGEKKLEGFPEFKGNAENTFNGVKKYTVSSMFRPFSVRGMQVRPVTEESGRAALKKGGLKKYTTDILIDGSLNARCFLSEGYRHQVRCHLSWIGFPIKGDRLYNPLFREGDSFDFHADYLKFPHPVTGIALEINL